MKLEFSEKIPEFRAFNLKVETAMEKELLVNILTEAKKAMSKELLQTPYATLPVTLRDQYDACAFILQEIKKLGEWKGV